VRRFLTEQGKSANSYSYILTNAKRSGLLRKLGGKANSGSNTRWVVVPKQKLLPPPSKGNGAKKKAAV
jgi:hypothetical protein